AIEMQHLTPLRRLAQFDPASGMFIPVAAHSIGVNNTQTANNVYVIAHGWMSGYLDWVNNRWSEGRLPLSWETWQGPVTAYAPSTEWLFKGNMTDQYLVEGKFGAYQPSFTVNSLGLAQAIHAADSTATILAFSWIDESATTTELDVHAGIPK